MPLLLEFKKRAGAARQQSRGDAGGGPSALFFSATRLRWALSLPSGCDGLEPARDAPGSALRGKQKTAWSLNDVQKSTTAGQQNKSQKARPCFAWSQKTTTEALHQPRSVLAAAGERDESPKGDPAAAKANVTRGGSSRQESEERPSRREGKGGSRSGRSERESGSGARLRCEKGGDRRQPHAAIKGPFQPEQNHTPL